MPFAVIKGGEPSKEAVAQQTVNQAKRLLGKEILSTSGQHNNWPLIGVVASCGVIIVLLAILNRRR